MITLLFKTRLAVWNFNVGKEFYKQLLVKFKTFPLCSLKIPQCSRISRCPVDCNEPVLTFVAQVSANENCFTVPHLKFFSFFLLNDPTQRR